MSGGHAIMAVTEKQQLVLCLIEDRINGGECSPNTVEISKILAISTGEVARILDALETFGFITRLRGKKRNIRLCSPSVKMAPDEHLIAELNARGYFVRKATYS